MQRIALYYVIIAPMFFIYILSLILALAQLEHKAFATIDPPINLNFPGDKECRFWSKAIKDFRTSLNLNQKEFSNLINKKIRAFGFEEKYSTTQQTVLNWETIPKIDSLTHIHLRAIYALAHSKRYFFKHAKYVGSEDAEPVIYEANIGRAIKKIRMLHLEANSSQFALETGYSRKTIRDIESGVNQSPTFGFIDSFYKYALSKKVHPNLYNEAKIIEDTEDEESDDENYTLKLNEIYTSPDILNSVIGEHSHVRERLQELMEKLATKTSGLDLQALLGSLLITEEKLNAWIAREGSLPNSDTIKRIYDYTQRRLNKSADLFGEDCLTKLTAIRKKLVFNYGDSLAFKVKKLRETLEMTPEMFARELNESVLWVKDLESGRFKQASFPSLFKMYRLGLSYGINPNFFKTLKPVKPM